jgi:hypothetical protein
MGWTADTELVSGISTDQNATPPWLTSITTAIWTWWWETTDDTFSFYRSQRYSADNLAPPNDLSYAIVGM